jgi:hypothetical protein
VLKRATVSHILPRSCVIVIVPRAVARLHQMQMARREVELPQPWIELSTPMLEGLKSWKVGSAARTESF